MRLLAVMPVYNEADRFLTEVLAHLMPLVDGVFIYDDQSTDSTVDVLQDAGVEFAVRPDSVAGFTEHEGEYRQWGWNTFEEVMKPERGDWILAHDADEKFFGIESLLIAMQQPMYVLGVTFYHMWNETHYRVDKAWAPTVSSRLFRYEPGGRFNQRRLASGSEPHYVKEAIVRGQMQRHTPFVFQHLGYMRDEDKKLKYDRYMKLDGGDFHSRAHLESIMDPSPILVPWTLS